jgi:hypothetical protein
MSKPAVLPFASATRAQVIVVVVLPATCHLTQTVARPEAVELGIDRRSGRSRRGRETQIRSDSKASGG